MTRLERFLAKPPRRISKTAVRARLKPHKRRYPSNWLPDICEAQGWKCAYCRRSIRRDGKGPPDRLATLDHVTPLSSGGKNCRKNLVAACVRCNTAKGSMPAAEFIVSLRDRGSKPVRATTALAGVVHESPGAEGNRPPSTGQPPMTEHEEQARELLAAELRSRNKIVAADRILHNDENGLLFMEAAALRAITKALTPSLPSSGVSERWARELLAAAWEAAGHKTEAIRVRGGSGLMLEENQALLTLIDHQAAQLAGMREALAGALAALRLAHDRTLEARDSELFDTLRHTINVACREITALSEPDKDSRR